MDEQDFGAGTGNEPQANGADNAPAVGLISQYVKDLSFENPNAPAVFQNQQHRDLSLATILNTQCAFLRDVWFIDTKIAVVWCASA